MTTASGRLAAMLVSTVVSLVPAAGAQEPPPALENRDDGAHVDRPHGGGKKIDEAFATFVVVPWVIAALAYPVGLAAHILIMSLAPRRALPLVHRVEAHRWKTLFLGAVNSLFLVVVFAATFKGAPPIAGLAWFLWWSLAFVGCHGIARSLGARALGHDPGEHPGAPGDLKALALGWFVLLGVSAFPGVGWILGTYWCVRGIGGVVLALFSVPEAPLDKLDPLPL